MWRAFHKATCGKTTYEKTNIWIIVSAWAAYGGTLYSAANADAQSALA
jgi:hypothetical protein